MTAADSRFFRFAASTDWLSAVVVLVLTFALSACTTYHVAPDAGSDATLTKDAGPPLADGSVAVVDSARDRPASIDSGGVDGMPPACLDGATRLCKDDPDLKALGNCGAGVELCSSGHWGACSVGPASKDSCTLIGDDATCNGKPNEGCPCVDGNQQPCGPAADVGICKRGTQTCAGGTWGACTGAVYAAARDCTSAADNDCDGLPDNTLDAACVCAATTKRPCGQHAGQDGKGRCVAGTQTCVVATDRKTSTWGTCTGSVGPAAADTCAPGNDDNCNGNPNEGCTCVEGNTQACGPAAAVGICKKGSQTCTGGAWGACVGAVLPAARDCTSTADNDCDGHPDNTIDTVCACASGATQACGQHPGQDGKGPCKAGSQTCVVATDKKSSAWGVCSGSVGPAPVDGCDPTNDDNCNGILHEGCTCVNGTTRSCGPAAIGICKPGTQTCANATWPTTCPGAVTAKARDCTSTLDNDCNGLPDNQETSICVCPAGTTGPCPGNNTGSCKSGTRTCITSADKTSTTWGTTCVGQVLPAAADTCVSGNDANCNGSPNDGCQCLTDKPPVACPCGTQACTNGKLGACVTTCAANQTCNSAGQCVCSGTLTSCNGTCVNTMTDPNNCGGCGNNFCATQFMGCSGGQCVCTSNTPNGELCMRPGQVRGVCWGGACVLPQYYTGCNSAADCVPGGCTGPGGYCLGTIDVAGQVSCSNNIGGYVVCSTSLGCSSAGNFSQIACGTVTLAGTACDGPSDCPAGSDCCATTQSGFSANCTPQAQPGVIGSGCPSLGPGNQLHTLCDPLNPTANCPAGQSCTTIIIANGEQATFLCE